MTDELQDGMSDLLRLREDANGFVNATSVFSSPFKAWRSEALRSLSTIFGHQDNFVLDFAALAFWRRRILEHDVPFEEQIEDRDQRQFDVDIDVARRLLDNAMREAGRRVRRALSAARPATASPSELPERVGLNVMSEIRIFLSHAAEDEDLAAALIDCVMGCMVIDNGMVRCTSVAGYKLPIGSHAAVVLRDDIGASVLVLGLLTPVSVSSGWVLFELGAAWGARKTILPLLATELDFEGLPGPLAGFHAIKLASPADLAQAMEQIATTVGAKLRNVPLMQAALQKFQSWLGMRGTERRSGTGADQVIERLPGKADLSAEAKKLLLAAVADRHGSIIRIEHREGVVLAANGQQFGVQGDARDQARWGAALEVLQRHGYVDDGGKNGNVFAVKAAGFTAADSLHERRGEDRTDPKRRP